VEQQEGEVKEQQEGGMKEQPEGEGKEQPEGEVKEQPEGEVKRFEEVENQCFPNDRRKGVMVEDWKEGRSHRRLHQVHFRHRCLHHVHLRDRCLHVHLRDRYPARRSGFVTKVFDLYSSALHVEQPVERIR